MSKVSPFEILHLGFKLEEMEQFGIACSNGDAEEGLSYAVHCLGSQRVADVVIESKNKDVALLAISEVDDFDGADKTRIIEVFAL